MREISTLPQNWFNIMRKSSIEMAFMNRKYQNNQKTSNWSIKSAVLTLSCHSLWITWMESAGIFWKTSRAAACFLVAVKKMNNRNINRRFHMLRTFPKAPDLVSLHQHWGINRTLVSLTTKLFSEYSIKSKPQGKLLQAGVKSNSSNYLSNK